MDLLTAATLLAASVPLSSFLMKVLFNGRYVSTREFDDFRTEVRSRFQDVRDDIQRLADDVT